LVAESDDGYFGIDNSIDVMQSIFDACERSTQNL